MVNGANNLILEIDLSNGRMVPRPLEDDILVHYLGGRGLGVYLFCQEVPADTDPFSENNVLVIAAGGLAGSSAPTAGRFSVTFKSPLTGTIASSNSGGFWGTVLKRSGYDAVIIRGKADRPVLIHISEKEVVVHPCSELWGKTIPQLSATLLSRFSRSARVLGIGPAGENLVRFAALINENGRAAARAGPGAVMGSKNLKAIVVEGGKKFLPAQAEMCQAGIDQANRLLRAIPITSSALRELGTAGLVKLIHDHDMLPHLNFRDVAHRHEDIDKISGETLRRQILVSPKPCFNCAIACGRQTRIGNLKGEGPEYETIAILGPNLGIYDLAEIARTNYACNEWGLDTISFGGTVGLLMELGGMGLLGGKTIKGKPIRFGVHGILMELARLTAWRQGIGAEIAEGAKRLAEKFNVPHLAMAVKGLELPGYDPRATMAQALGYATSPRGGCHLQGGYAITLGFFGGSREVNRFLIDTTAGHVVNQQDSGCIADSFGICRFSSFAFGENELARIVTGFTGVDRTPRDLELAARLIQDRERRFNLGTGFTCSDDTLPARMFEEKILIAGEFRAIDRQSHFQPLLKKYYDIRNWDESGVPRG